MISSLIEDRFLAALTEKCSEISGLHKLVPVPAHCLTVFWTRMREG